MIIYTSQKKGDHLGRGKGQEGGRTVTGKGTEVRMWLNCMFQQKCHYRTPHCITNNTLMKFLCSVVNWMRMAPINSHISIFYPQLNYWEGLGSCSPCSWSEMGLFVVVPCGCQAGWPANFWGHSALYLSPCYRRTRTPRYMGSWDLNWETHLHSKGFTHWAISVFDTATTSTTKHSGHLNSRFSENYNAVCGL